MQRPFDFPSPERMHARMPAFFSLLALLLAACTVSGSEPLPPPQATAVDNPNTVPGGQSSAARFPAEKYADLEIVTLLPRDGIPAIDNPQFLSATEADNFYDADELVMGVKFGDEARAYSVPFLSSHEIVNDEVNGVKIAVTW